MAWLRNRLDVARNDKIMVFIIIAIVATWFVLLGTSDRSLTPVDSVFSHLPNYPVYIRANEKKKKKEISTTETNGVGVSSRQIVQHVCVVRV